MDHSRLLPAASALIVSTAYNPVDLTCALTLLVMSCIPPKAPLFSQLIHTNQTAATVNWDDNVYATENITVAQLNTHFASGVIVASQYIKHTYTGVSNQTRIAIPLPSVTCPWLTGLTHRLEFPPDSEIRELCLTPSPTLSRQRANKPRRYRPVQHDVASVKLATSALQLRPLIWLTKTVGVATWNSAAWPSFASNITLSPDKRIIFNATSVDLPVMAIVIDCLQSLQSLGGNSVGGGGGGSGFRKSSKTFYDGKVVLSYKNAAQQPDNLRLHIDMTNPGWQIPHAATVEQLFVADTIVLGRKGIFSSATTFLTVVVFRNFVISGSSTNITATVNCYEPTEQSQINKGRADIFITVDAGKEYGVGVAEWDVTEYSENYLFGYEITNHGPLSTGQLQSPEPVYTRDAFSAPTSLDGSTRMTYSHQLHWIVIHSSRIMSRSYDAFSALVADCADNDALESVKIDATDVSSNQFRWDGDTGLLMLLCPHATNDLLLGSGGFSHSEPWCSPNAVYTLWVLCDSW